MGRHARSAGGMDQGRQDNMKNLELWALGAVVVYFVLQKQGAAQAVAVPRQAAQQAQTYSVMDLVQPAASAGAAGSWDANLLPMSGFIQ